MIRGSGQTMTAIERLHLHGILRRGTPARGFHFKHAGGGRVTAQDLERIEKLKIPPAGKDGAVKSAANGRIQTVGQDAAGPWEYNLYASHIGALEGQKNFRG